jgi:hypothetical protein
MSLAAACGWSLARSTGVAIAAAPVSICIERRMRSFTGPARTFAWGFLLVPFLFPTLLSGYAYSGSSLGLVRAGIWTILPASMAAAIREWLAANNGIVDEVLLCALLLSKVVPVGTMLLRFAPEPAYSPMAWRCRQLASAPGKSRLARFRDWWEYAKYGPYRSVLAATGLIFIVAFQEFELPSLLNRSAWTVWLFDAQVGGLELSESLRSAIWPLTLQVFIVVPLWWVLRRARGTPRRHLTELRITRLSAWRDCLYLLAAFCLACLIPVTLVGSETVRGLAAIAGNRSQLERLSRETVAGVAFALAASWIALRLAEWEFRRGAPGSRFAKWIVPVLALPGLFGPLVMSLGLVSILQWSALNVVYRTPVSLVCGLTLHLLPRALLLTALARAVDQSSSRYAALLLGQARDSVRARAADELRWRLGGAARFGILAVLTYWGYLELTVAYLLGPTTIVSVPVLLYNQMHFGKNAVLSAMTFLAVVVPVALFIATAALRPVIRRFFWR